RVTQFARLFLGQPLDHAPKEHGRALHAFKRAFAPENLGFIGMLHVRSRHVWCFRCYLLTISRSSLPALKNGTRFAGTATVVPVLGLRPSFILRFRRRKLPKPLISILSPRARAVRMPLKIVLTTTSAWRFVRVVTCSDNF